MSSIYIAAIFTTFLSLFIIGGIIFWKASPSDKKVYLIAILLQLPMCAGVYYLIREPYLRGVWLWLASLLHPQLPIEEVRKTMSYLILRNFEAPFAEDLAKLWPLLIPWFRRQINRQNAVRIAMALGLGFGIGEMWFLAELVQRTSPNLVPPHWYQFYLLGGYVGERLIVCFMHGAFVAVALCQLGKGSLRLILGILGMMSLHFLGNLPILLAKINLGGFASSTWTALLAIWINIYFILMLVLLTYLSYKKTNPATLLFGSMKCPECGKLYDRPFFGMNVFRRRYEKCSHCKKFHWVQEKEAIKPEV